MTIQSQSRRKPGPTPAAAQAADEWFPAFAVTAVEGAAALHSSGHHIRNTPKRVGSIGAFSAAEIDSANTSRVSAGSMIPSSHKRALA